MNKSFVKLDPATIDDYIEQTEQQLPQTSDAIDARYLRDLRYLHQKDAILQRAAQRLELANTVDEQSAQTGQGGVAWSERNTLSAQPRGPEHRRGRAWPKLVAALAAILLVLGVLLGTSQFLLTHSQPATAHSGSTATTTPKTTATVASDILFSDPLSQNIHNFAIDSQHFFKNGAYHILNQSNNGTGTLVDQKFTGPNLTYTITMEEIAGDDTATTNTSGMMFHYNVKANKTITFYAFEIVNDGANSQYSFWKYDLGHSNPWAQLKLFKAGREFHAGHGPAAVNTLKVVEKGSLFTFYVNNVQAGSARDSSLPDGQMGLLVNLKGTEVAFSNLLVTRP